MARTKAKEKKEKNADKKESVQQLKIVLAGVVALVGVLSASAYFGGAAGSKKAAGPPPPPPEPWGPQEAPSVDHLDLATFADHVAKTEHVLTFFYAPWCGHCKSAKPEVEEAAKEFLEDGSRSLAGIDCTLSPTLCQQYDVKGYPTMIYFKDGERAFDYGEARKKDAFIKFLQDPQPPPPPPPPPKPWSEEAPEVTHVTASKKFKKLLAKKDHVLTFFYAPWCGHCKAAKPEYLDAAKEFVGDEQREFVAVDCTAGAGAQALCGRYEVTGYPTIKYFAKGKLAFDYAGGRKKDDFIEFMTDPKPPPPPPPPPTPWIEEAPEVNHLDSKTWDDHLASHDKVLAFLYAPWCGHCKAAKPEYRTAAIALQDDPQASLVGVDCTDPAGKPVCDKFDVKGFPTIKYFAKGEYAFDYSEGRKARDFEAFMRNPQPPPPPPPPPKPWKEEMPDVTFLADSDAFQTHTAAQPHTLMLFYAPWCGHCKAAKPEYQAAAAQFAGDATVSFAAVDCTLEETRQLCQDLEVSGYPTIKYFAAGSAEPLEYSGGRTADDFAAFVSTKASSDAGDEAEAAEAEADPGM